MNPRVFKTEGLKHLDRVIEICARYGIYTVIDLHAAPGGECGLSLDRGLGSGHSASGTGEKWAESGRSK